MNKTMIVIILLLNMLIMMPAQAESNKGKPMKKLTLLIDSKPVKLIPSPLIQEDRWLVPLESFCHLIGAKVDYPDGMEMVVICKEQQCVPITFDDTSLIATNEVVYASPKMVAELLGLLVSSTSEDQIEINTISRAAQDTRIFEIPAWFSLPDLKGRKISFSQFRGKKTLLYLWASW